MSRIALALSMALLFGATAVLIMRRPKP